MRVQRLCSRITTGRMSHIIVKEFAGKGGNNSIDLNRGGTEVLKLGVSLFFFFGQRRFTRRRPGQRILSIHFK